MQQPVHRHLAAHVGGYVGNGLLLARRQFKGEQRRMRASMPRSTAGECVRLFDEIVAVMKQSNRFVPLFNDKHLSYNWADAKWMYDRAQALGVPFMAGSSLPLGWRSPWIEHELDCPLREAVAIGKIVAELEKRPERLTWDKIIVATPKYLQSERSGMGPKLHGLGVYVQPLTGARSIEGLDGDQDIDVSNQGESDTTNPEDGKKNRSKVYVAPYSYIQVYVIDPKTMKVIEKVARHDFTKLNDPNSTALDVGKSIPLDMLASA
ncbi:MAG: hypothetical protein HC782_04640 [Gammaproteobacteria bacterium]|nr:hypothetical protein [Gammaproteobacteria bacterium]